MIEIALNNISKSYGADLVLTNISFEMHTKDRIGLIGGNGTGKTTIFKIVAGIENADTGDVIIRKGVRVGYLQQIPVYPDEYPVHQVLRTAFSQLDELTHTIRQLEQQMSLLSGEQLAKTRCTTAG